MSHSFPPSDPLQAPGQPPLQYVPQKNKNLTIIMLILCGVMAIPCLGVCAGLLLPAVQNSREAARRMQCSNNLKHIALAMHNYHAVYGILPPAYTVDADGQPLHSWRTVLLPFLDQAALYKQIDLSKPWDDPANAAIAATDLSVFMCPSMPGTEGEAITSYVAIVDPRGVMSGPKATRFRDVIDGTAYTILVTEVDASLAVPWMSPNDITLQQFLTFDRDRMNPSSHHPGGRQVAISDGSVRFIADAIDPRMLEALVTKDGGENIADGF